MIAQPEPPAEERSYYNISQAAAVLGVSRVSVWRWIRDGDLPAIRLGHRTTRIRREDLESVILRLGLRASPGEADGCEHFVQFYERDAALVSAVGSYVGAALRADEAAIVVASCEHQAALDARLTGGGLDLAAARTEGRYVTAGAGETLARFMAGELPDPDRFAQVIGRLIRDAGKGGRGVKVFGEMVALLAAEGNEDGTLRLEELWNALQQELRFSLFCAYPMECLAGQSLAGLLGGVCAEHSRVIPAESYADLSTADAQLRAVASLQQQAGSLAAEVERRKDVEAKLQLALESERQARDAAEAALRQREEFLSIAAHELKTPITSLNGHAQLIERRLTQGGHIQTEQAAEALRAIAGQGRKLSRLVNELFDVSQLHEGKLTLVRQPADIMETVRQCIDSAQLSGSNHHFSLDGPPSCVLSIDALRIEQVITNLLDNAVKYSPGADRVDVLLHQDGDAVELSVRDYGLGIPPETRVHIFERFYQAHASGYHSGMGLGLYVSRQIVEMHGGQIGVDFPEDGGSRFFMSLPRGCAQ